MKIQSNSKTTAQEIQDMIFRRMPIEKKLKKLDSFFRFAKVLNLINKNYDRKKSSLSFFKERARVRSKRK